MSSVLKTLQSAVQRNCHIADAAGATDYTLCIYLLKMREFYRWEQGHTFADAMPKDSIGDWLREREELWNTLETEEFSQLQVEGTHFDPFDAEAINKILVPQGLVYSAGLGYRSQPHFFLGELERHDQQDDFEVLIAAREHARDLTAPPAMSLGKTIFVRRESLRRMLWERIEQWYWNEPDTPMARVMGYYDFKHNLNAALDEFTERELPFVVLHETGEVMAGKLLGPAWEDMLANLPRSKAEIMLRAVRDHLADAISTLPQLLQEGNEASIHFYLANLNNMRKDLYPALIDEYKQWRDSGDLTSLRELSEKGRHHWEDLAKAVLQLWATTDATERQAKIEVLIEGNRL